jgi:hypothetical protein
MRFPAIELLLAAGAAGPVLAAPLANTKASQVVVLTGFEGARLVGEQVGATS